MDGTTPLSQEMKKLLHVLIVDDEAIVRDDIKKLFCWEKHGYQLVGEAENGQEALNLLRTRHIDIIIADIEMPVMNGLELASQILSRTNDIKFIFLTAHSDFEFARISMRLGIDSYILKHEMSAKVLLNELERARYSLEKISYQKMACINEAMHSLLYTSRSTESCQKIFKDNGIEFQAGNTFLVSVELYPNRISEELKNLITVTVRCAVNKIEIAGSTVFSIEENSVGALIVMNDSACSKGNWNLTVVSCFNQVQEQLQTVLGKSCFILVSPIISSEQELHQIYFCLKKEISKFYFYETPRIVFCKEENSCPIHCEEDIAQLCDFLDKRQFQNAEITLQEVFTEKIPKIKDMALFKKYLTVVINQMAKIWNSDYGVNKPIDSFSLYQELLGLENVFYVYERLKEILSQLINFQNERRQERIRKIKRYVENHYAEDISLGLLGDLIGVSETYMSQLFKQQFGVSFKTYLKNIRMKKAEEMLLTGNLQIQEIGEKVGYSSTPYFCLVFKRHFGLTPSEYIRRCSR